MEYEKDIGCADSSQCRQSKNLICENSVCS